MDANVTPEPGFWIHAVRSFLVCIWLCIVHRCLPRVGGTDPQRWAIYMTAVEEALSQGLVTCAVRVVHEKYELESTSFKLSTCS
jgi:hypothetical protein